MFATESTFRAWVRFAGPGPLAPPDLDDNGILSIGLKLMGVAGPKLLDDEQMTQDFTGISSPTFTTPNIVENLKLQRQVSAGTPVLYFVDPFDSHYLDGIMQGLYARTHTNPLEVQYYSCVPYLLGEGQAVHYSMKPTSHGHVEVPEAPLRQLPARGDGGPARGPATCTSTSWCSCRRTPAACRSRTPRWSGRRSCRRS